jgi:phosphate transport system protein
MIHRNIDAGLSNLNQRLLTMAGYVEQGVEFATDGWRFRNLAKVQEVYGIEQKVNQAHLEVDAACVQLLALQQPMAADLRFIVSCIKINNDLERMVDLAVNIANNTEFYLQNPQAIHVEDLSQMSDEVRVMVREVLDAFVKTDERLARRVLSRDDRVDAYKRKIVEDCLSEMKRDPKNIEQGMNLIFIAKNLERIGDHATNIAEDVIFSVSGKDIRHSEVHRKQPPPAEDK